MPDSAAQNEDYQIKEISLKTEIRKRQIKSRIYDLSCLKNIEIWPDPQQLSSISSDSFKIK